MVEFSDTCFLDEQLSKEFAENATKVAHKICEPWLSSNYQVGSFAAHVLDATYKLCIAALQSFNKRDCV